MKPMPASALAATVWFLMAGWILMAPSVDCARRGLEKETPLSQWENVSRFDSSQGCERYRATVMEAEKGERGNAYADRYFSSVCVPDNDPRLRHQE